MLLQCESRVCVCISSNNSTVDLGTYKIGIHFIYCNIHYIVRRKQGAAYMYIHKYISSSQVKNNHLLNHLQPNTNKKKRFFYARHLTTQYARHHDIVSLWEKEILATIQSVSFVVCDRRVGYLLAFAAMNSTRQTTQRNSRQNTPRKTIQRSRQPSFDRDATIRSNRSGNSTRSSLQNIVQQNPTKDPEERRRYENTDGGHLARHQVPPPPPYQASHSPFPDIRRDSSPSTIMSYESSRWEDANTRNPRWSTWTTDSTLLLSDEGNMDETMDTKAHSSFSKSQSYGRRPISPLNFQQYEQDQIAGPSHSPPTSRASTPPSPTSEAALDAALSSTMLALTTANSLLLSTMSSRRELARLRALEAELDSDLTKKEEEIKRRIEFNKCTTRWMERACQKLDNVIQGRDTLNGIEELDEINAGLHDSSYNIPSSTPGSRLMAKHDRAPSTAATGSEQLAATFGIVEAKDDNATLGKSAAKRLERMLQKSTALSGPIAENGSAVPSRLANAVFSQNHSRSSSSATTSSNTESNRSEDAIGNATKTNTRPGVSRSSGSAINGLQLRLSSSRLATPLTATATTSESVPVTESNVRNLDRIDTSFSRQSLSARSMSDTSAITSNAMENATGKTDAEENPGNTSNAAKLLSSLVNSRPSSRLSMGTNVAEQEDETQHIQIGLANGTASSQFLTPPMPSRDLAPVESSIANTSSNTPALLKRQSISNIRSPSAIRMGSGHARGTGSSVADDIQGVAITEKNGGRKGALEALRRLNSNGNTSTTNAEAGSASNDTVTPGANDPLRGWGGTFASWIGVGRSSAETTPSIDDAITQTSEPSVTPSAPRDAAFNAPDLAV